MDLLTRALNLPIAEQDERIVAGARKHFFVHGFWSVTMDDLANELAISKKTLYTRFQSKAALLEDRYPVVSATRPAAGSWAT